MRNRIYFTAQLQQMAESEILTMIPKDTLARIQQIDSHPMFKVFSIGHEGDASGANVVGIGARLVKWARDVVIQMFNHIESGLKVFKGHNPDSNSHSGRMEVGELVGKTMREINGVLHTLGAVYIKPEFQDKKLDVASLEGVVEFGERIDGDIDVLNVKSITGLAVDDGDVSTPAMPGATLQAALQMFTQENEREFQQMEITKEQVKEAILKLGLNVVDLFSDSQIESSEPAKKSKQTEYEHAKRVEIKLGKVEEENSKLQGSITKLEGDNTILREKASTGIAKELIGKIATDKKLTPEVQKFIGKNIGSFKSDKEGGELNKDLEIFVDVQTKEYKEQAELYGVKDVKVTTEDDKGGGDKGAGAGDDDSRKTPGENVISDENQDPEKNDFIPKT